MKKIYKYMIIACLGITVFACDDFLDVNQDPNNPTPETIPYLLELPTSQTSIASAFGSSWAVLTGMWSQHWTQSGTSNQYNTYDSYSVTNTDFGQQWGEIFAGGLNDLQDVREQATAVGDWNAYLMATALQAFGLQTVADFYDQIPLSEAFQGDSGNTTPMFDAGADIYDELIIRLDDALAKDFAATTNQNLGNVDFLFGGDMDRWMEFVNTLKLKIFLRQSASRPGVTNAGISGMLTAGTSFLSMNAAITQYIDAPNQSNPLYESNIRQLNTPVNIRASQTFISWLEDNSDPRIDAYFVFNPGQTFHRGLQQGEGPSGGNIPNPALVSIAKQTAIDPFYFFSTDEVLFMLAEAELIAGTPANAKMLYDQAVMAAFQRVGENGSSFVAVGGAYEYPAAGTQAQKLEAIITQKWAASVQRGYESFFDQNRTGYPQISSVASDDVTYVPGQWTYSLAGSTGGAFPKRLIWPTTERSRNPNTPVEVPLTTNVWWAQ